MAKVRLAKVSIKERTIERDIDVRLYATMRSPLGLRAIRGQLDAPQAMVQGQLCDPFGLAITIAHYPTGASKWNPIEHRLFSEISKNWAAEPLQSYETMLKFILFSGN